MPRSEDLLGTRMSRPESPEVEFLVQEALGEAFTVLLSEKGLYQKVDVSTDRLRSYLKGIGSTAEPTLLEEFSRRPFAPVSPSLSPELQKQSAYLCGDSPLSARASELRLAFPLPSVKLECQTCGDDHTFASETVLWWDFHSDRFPRLGERTEQIFNLTYVCSQCRTHPVAFMVRREGLRLFLCGRSERLPVRVSRQVPKALQPILRDAVSAANENDVPAGFYHLRTFCEHYMKASLGIPNTDRLTGDELGAQYNASLDRRMTAGMPSLPAIYDRASKFMHERSGGEEDFRSLLAEIDGHMAAKELFQRYK